MAVVAVVAAVVAAASTHLHNSSTPRHRQQRNSKQSHINTKRPTLPRMVLQLLETKRTEAKHSPVVIRFSEEPHEPRDGEGRVGGRSAVGG